MLSGIIFMKLHTNIKILRTNASEDYGQESNLTKTFLTQLRAEIGGTNVHRILL